jgi:hypothetical protein
MPREVGVLACFAGMGPFGRAGILLPPHSDGPPFSVTL